MFSQLWVTKMSNLQLELDGKMSKDSPVIVLSCYMSLEIIILIYPEVLKTIYLLNALKHKSLKGLKIPMNLPGNNLLNVTVNFTELK